MYWPASFIPEVNELWGLILLIIINLQHARWPWHWSLLSLGRWRWSGKHIYILASVCLSSMLVPQFYRVVGEQRWQRKGLGELRTIAVKKKRIGCAAIIEKATICWLILTQLRFAYLTFLVSPHTYGWVQLANRSSNSHSFKLAWKPFFWLEHFQAFFYLTHSLRINWSYQQPWEIFSASCRLDFFSLCSFP